jgi:hypothetical protein
MKKHPPFWHPHMEFSMGLTKEEWLRDEIKDTKFSITMKSKQQNSYDSVKRLESELASLEAELKSMARGEG